MHEAIEQIIRSDKMFLTPAEVAAVLGCNSQSIRKQAYANKDLLGFSVIVAGTRVRIPKDQFLDYISGRTYIHSAVETDIIQPSENTHRSSVSENKTMQKRRTRCNGTGTVFKRKDRNVWAAQIVIGWKPPVKENGNWIAIKKTCSGFKTKKEALLALNKLIENKDTQETKTRTLRQVFDEWVDFYSSRVKDTTMKGYISAFKYFESIEWKKIKVITSKDVQECLDTCPYGKRVRELIKSVAKLIWAYAFDSNYVEKDVTNNLYTGKGETIHYEPLSDKDLQKIKDAIGKEQYADYIYCLCYLGFRPGEFFDLKKESLHINEDGEEKLYYFVGGSKTAAGTNRVVVIPNQILEYVLERYKTEGTDYMFPMYVYANKERTVLKEMRQMKHKYFNALVFKPMLERLGIDGNKVVYSARHTYADKLKRAEGTDKAKAALIGHTDYDFTKKHYQTTDFDDLKAVVDTIS